MKCTVVQFCGIKLDFFACCTQGVNLFMPKKLHWKCKEVNILEVNFFLCPRNIFVFFINIINAGAIHCHFQKKIAKA